jgi:hypothetical protein
MLISEPQGPESDVSSSLPHSSSVSEDDEEIDFFQNIGLGLFVASAQSTAGLSFTLFPSHSS